MFPKNYFAPVYFAPAYFPPAGEEAAEEKPRDSLAYGLDVDTGSLRERQRREDNEIIEILAIISMMEDE